MKHMDESKKSGMLNKVLSLIAVATVFTMVGTGIGATAMQTNALAEATPQAEEIDTADYSASPAVAVYEKCSESVVGVITYSESYSRTTGNVEKTEVGEGSGIVISDDGYILTNNHVIADGNYYEALLSSGDKVEAELVGADSGTDIAVLHVEGQTLKAIEIGTSTDLKVGETVIAIGNPGGSVLANTVTQGIVSALERDMKNTFTRDVKTIQHDAAINPGNSGGALVDDEGKLIGINSIIESSSGSSSGVGFAIDGNYAVKIAKTIISGEKVTHAYLGASLATVNAENAQRAQLAVSQGAYVRSIESDSPADKAGLKEGDVITKVDDQDIMSADALKLAIRAHDVGDKVTITVMRGSSEKTLEVTLGSDEKLQEQEAAQQQEAHQQSQQGGNRDQGQGNGQGDAGSDGYGLGDLGSLLGGN